MKSRPKVFLLSCIILFLATPNILKAETIWLPAPSGGGRQCIDIPLKGNVTVEIGGEKRILQSVNISCNYNDEVTANLNLVLDRVLKFRVDENIFIPDYKINRKEYSYSCSDCKGQYEIFIPIYTISRISCLKPEVFEIYLKDKAEPIYAYLDGIKIRAMEDLGAFGKAKFEAKMGKKGDTIYFPDNLPEIKIQKKGDLSAKVTMDSGRKKQLTDFRPGEFLLDAGGAKLSISVKQIQRIEIIEASYSKTLVHIQLKTGEKKKFRITGIESFDLTDGIVGKGKQWYEFIPLRYIKIIDFM